MSRTYKHIPDWVRLNDFSVAILCEHRHHMLGISLIDYWGKEKHYSDTCTALKVYDQEDARDWYYMLCRRYFPWEPFGGGKFPHDCRVKPYRAKRRDFTKRQVKIYNSNPDMHDDLEFMNDEEFGLTKRETTHRRSY